MRSSFEWLHNIENCFTRKKSLTIFRKTATKKTATKTATKEKPLDFSIVPCYNDLRCDNKRWSAAMQIRRKANDIWLKADTRRPPVGLTELQDYGKNIRNKKEEATK